MDDLWQRSQRFSDAMIEQYHEPVSRAVLEANAYLRNTTSGYLGRRFQIFVDLLGAPNQVQTRGYADDYFVVVTPSAEPQIDGIRHVAYLHYVVDPLTVKFSADIQKKHALGDYAQGAPALEERYKSNFLELTNESMIKAIESRMDRKPAGAEQALKEGFVLTPALAEQLALYEKQDVALRLYFPNLIAGLDFKREEQRLEKVEFASARPRTVRTTPAPHAAPADRRGQNASRRRASLHGPRSRKGQAGLPSGGRRDGRETDTRKGVLWTCTYCRASERPRDGRPPVPQGPRTGAGC